MIFEESPNAIIEFDKATFKERIKFLFRGTCEIKIIPNDEIFGYDVWVRYGRRRKAPKIPSVFKDELDF